MKKNLVVYKLRKYLEKLYEGYPTHAFYEYEYEKGTGIEEGVKILEKDKIIKRESNTKKNAEKRDGYRLTAEGLKLVELWHHERLIIWGILISLAIFVLMIFQIYLIVCF